MITSLKNEHIKTIQDVPLGTVIHFFNVDDPVNIFYKIQLKGVPNSHAEFEIFEIGSQSVVSGILNLGHSFMMPEQELLDLVHGISHMPSDVTIDVIFPARRNIFADPTFGVLE